MIVAGLQMDIAWEDPRANFDRAAALAERAARAGARLLVLPEMFATGFSMRAQVVAEHAGAVRDFLAKTARAHDAWVIAGYAEPGSDRPRNACSVVAPDGSEAGRYHKIHPFSLAGEQQHFDAGDDLFTVDVEGLRVTPLICYDLRFPELFRCRAKATDLFAVVANWPTKRAHVWRLMLRARAVDAQAWVLGVNRVGIAEGYSHDGDSALVRPDGNVVASLTGQVGVVLGEADSATVSSLRERHGFLDDRRPDLYPTLEYAPNGKRSP